MAVVTTGEDRRHGSSSAQHTDSEVPGGHTDRPDVRGVPARGEPQHADARRRPPALREARGRRARLRPRDVRADARRRGDRAAVPQAPLPLAAHRRPAGVEGRRAVRHRAPRPAQRAAQARPDPRAARPLLPAAQHPAGLGAAAVGGPRHRGPARRPGRDVHQDPPRPGRRRLRDAAARRACSAPTPTSATCRRPWAATDPRGRPQEAAATHSLVRGADRARCAPRWASPPRRPGCRARWSGRSARACGTRPRRCRSTPRARSSTRRSPAPAGSPPRTGRSSGCAAIGKATGTTLNDVVLAMCGGAMRTYLLELDALPEAPLVSMVPVGLNAKQSQVASAEGGNAVGSVMVPARRPTRRPGRPAASDPPRR